MTLGQELQTAISRRHPDTVCLGNTCYVRLEGGNLAKIELAASSGYYDTACLTVLNRRTGPVDSLKLRFGDFPTKKETDSGSGDAAWDIYHPSLDIEALSEHIEKYLRVFEGPDVETR